MPLLRILCSNATLMRCVINSFLLRMVLARDSQQRYRGSPHFVISQFVIPAILWFCFSWFWRKKSKNNFFSEFIFFRFYFFPEFFFSWFLIYSFLFVYSDCHLIDIKIFLLDTTLQIQYACRLENAIWIGEKNHEKKAQKVDFRIFWTHFEVLH